jgi:endonuclease G, mitochondrial
LWEGIESAVRQLTERKGELYVVPGPAFQGTQLKTLNGRVLVPTATWKAVYDPVRNGAGAYMCSNVSHPRCNTLSIAALAQKIGLDPFPLLPDAVKQTAMPLPAAQPSRRAPSRHLGHREQERGMLDWLLR